MINSYEGICCPCDQVVSMPQKQELICIICYQVMTKPVILECGSGHIYGMACIRQWIKQNNKNNCPYCRKTVNSWKIHHQLKQEVQKLEAKCSYCLNWGGNISQLQAHHEQCQAYKQYLQQKLNKTIEIQKQILDIQINPHLMDKHLGIYNEHVKNWQWLGWDHRNWKWWWWASNAWWTQPCVKCNSLWHKYQKKIDRQQAQRIQLLEMLDKLSGFKIQQLFEEN